MVTCPIILPASPCETASYATDRGMSLVADDVAALLTAELAFRRASLIPGVGAGIDLQPVSLC